MLYGSNYSVDASNVIDKSVSPRRRRDDMPRLLWPLLMTLPLVTLADASENP